MQTSDFIPASSPAIANIQSCETWLAVKRFADPEQACAAFLGLLDEIEDAPPPAPTCLEVLERLRVSMHASLEELDRKYTGKSLPLSPAEDAAFSRACDLWLAQVRAWRRLQRASRKNEELGESRALLALRVVESCVGLVYTHLAAHREIGAETWRWLHQSYSLAESKGLAEIEVSTPGVAGTTTCARLYAAVLLSRVGNAYALSFREFTLMKKWASRWSGKVNLWRSAENGGGLAVDLAGDRAPIWLPAGMPGSSLRFIDCAGVARSLRARKQKLAQGLSPAALGLGRDCPAHTARDLIDHLLGCWSDAPLTREFPRRAVGGATEIVSGFPGIHLALTGKTFESGARTWNYSQRTVEQIHIFQRASDSPVQNAPRTPHEQWDAMDESANGFRLRRAGTGTRLALGQLLGVRPRGASQFILCEIRWISQEPDGAINVGAKAIPGLPQACAIRPVSDATNHPAPWSQAFVLPLSRGLAPNLVLPMGWFQQQRVLEMKLDDTLFRVRLDEVLDRGYDYHRARFTALESM